MPLLHSFHPAAYQHKGKIWGIDSAPNGIVYMAADKGLLEFDGSSWKTFKGSKGFMRSLLVTNDSTIYTGSDLDFGVWQRDEYQAFTYRSLYPFQEVFQETIEEFWQVHSLGNDIVFVSSQNVYIYKDEQLVKIAAPAKIGKSWLVGNTLYVADEVKGLFSFDGFALKPIFNYPEQGRFQIEGLSDLPTGLMLVTRDAGLMLYKDGDFKPLFPALSKQLAAAKVFSFERLGHNQLAFGTVLKGLFITDLEGNILHQINKDKGLLNNTILSQHYSAYGQLWLGMDMGASSLALENDFSIFYDNRGEIGAAKTAFLQAPFLYVGTNQGLYYSDWEALNNAHEAFHFRLVPQTEGQVWTLAEVKGQLLMGHDKGLFKVVANSVAQIDSREGVWDILPYGEHLLTGNYNGISIYTPRADSWAFQRKMPTIAGSCNQLRLGPDSLLWIHIPNYGLLNTALDQALNPTNKQFFSADSLPGEDLYLLATDASLQIHSDQWIHTYQPRTKTFLTHPRNREELPNSVAAQQLTQSATQLDDNYLFLALQNGFLLRQLVPNVPSTVAAETLLLRRITAFNTHEKQAIAANGNIPYRLNNCSLEFTVAQAKRKTFYQYKIDEQPDWSEWTQNHRIELLGLSPGNHSLAVRARVGEEPTQIVLVDLQVDTPWHQSPLAYLCYLGLLALAVYSVLRWRRTSLEQQSAALVSQKQKALAAQAQQHEEKLQQIEQERLQTEYEEVKQQLRNKTIELANKAKENEEKNRLLLTLKEKCEQGMANPSISKMSWKEMDRLLDAYLNTEDKTFEIQMDELHQEFLKKLKQRFPQLSRNDLRLCVYLKIGISSKEIADILNIQPSSFYISRSRLRKKLELGAEDKLYDFLNGI